MQTATLEQIERGAVLTAAKGACYHLFEDCSTLSKSNVQERPCCSFKCPQSEVVVLEGVALGRETGMWRLWL